MVKTDTPPAIRALLGEVTDPEIPVLTIEDLGILRDVSVAKTGRVTVSITPTYSGCPAMTVIEEDITAALNAAGYDDVVIQTVFSPAWTTAWMTPEARAKLRDFGIAPPQPADTAEIRCPRCAEDDIATISLFGSTACKALLVCNQCGEPFDYFKAI